MRVRWNIIKNKNNVENDETEPPILRDEFNRILKELKYYRALRPDSI